MGWVRSDRDRGEDCRAFKLASTAFLCSDTCWDFSSPRCGVLITVNTRLVAGGCGAAWGSQGSNDGGQWPGAPGGRFVGGDSLLLM